MLCFIYNKKSPGKIGDNVRISITTKAIIPQSTLALFRVEKVLFLLCKYKKS